MPVSRAACATPSSWRSSRPGLPKDSRSPRTPSAGFSSPSRVANATGLSEPASRVRTTTYRSASPGPAAERRSAPRRRSRPAPRRVGSSLRLRKQSSVRNRPTPSTGASAAERADSPSATLARILIGLPSAVAPGPDHAASAARASRVRRPPGARPPAASGSISTVPAVPSTSRRVPGGTVIAPWVPTTQGMPSWRAMIAVWLVGPPRSVTSATTRRRLEAGGVGRREVLGDQHRRHVRRRDARLGLADQAGDDASLDVAQVGDPLGHQPAHAGEDVDELLHGRVHRGEQVVARPQVTCGPRRADPCRGPVRRSRSAPRRRHPTPCRPWRAKPSATAATASSYAASAASSSRALPSKRAIASGETSARTTRAGA